MFANWNHVSASGRPGGRRTCFFFLPNWIFISRAATDGGTMMEEMGVALSAAARRIDWSQERWVASGSAAAEGGR